MIKKLSLSLLITLLTALSSWAGLAVGSWKHHPVFGQTMQQVLDTPDKVFYTTSGVLYSYDKKSQETRSYENGMLSDYNIDKIFYNFDDNYLMIAYENANIDLLYPDDRVVNLPDLKDVTVDMTKEVIDVDFYEGKIYVCASFGLVIYDQKTGRVLQSGLYKKPVCGAMAGPENLIICYDKYSFKRIPMGGRISSINDFEHLSGVPYAITQMRPLDRKEGRFVVNTLNGLYVRRYDGSIKQNIGSDAAYHPANGLFISKDGLGFIANESLYSISSVGDVVRGKAVPADLLSQVLGTYSGPDKIWGGDGKGIACYDITSLPAKVISGKARPNNASASANIHHIVSVPGKPGFIITNRGQSQFLPGIPDNAHPPVMGADYVENGIFNNIDLKEGITYDYPDSKKLLSLQNMLDGVISPSFVIADPEDPDTYFMGSTFECIYVVKNGKQMAKFYSSSDPQGRNNAPFTDWWGTKTYSGTFDREGNLWVCTWGEGGLSILPSAKRKKPATVKRTDWVNVIDNITGADAFILPCKHSDMVYFTTSAYGAKIFAMDTKGNYTSPRQFTRREWTSLTDQDGKILNLEYRYGLLEDLEGRIWIAGTGGIYEIANPKMGIDPAMTVNHLKVPRNDGSGLADYLLTSEEITSMSVDGSNRKWISTKNSGVYLVSPRGDQILLHLTSANSPLPTNAVNCVYADPYSNSVFMGTCNGLFEYSSDSAPAADTYDEVYAYPNPVTPDYGGWITIKNLMGNSLVKICDAQMNVLAQIQSEGGMALWDGCNMGGERVKSGVYYVVASTGGGNSGSEKKGGVVAKILVVN